MSSDWPNLQTTTLVLFEVPTEITCWHWFDRPLVCFPNKWWHVSGRATCNGRVLTLTSDCPQMGHGKTVLNKGLVLFFPQCRLFHYMAQVLIFVLCCMWPCMLHVCVPSLLPQRMSAASLAPQSTMPCVALVVSWAAASHTQQWCPSTLSSAVCRFVWKLYATASSSSYLPAPQHHVGSSVMSLDTK